MNKLIDELKAELCREGKDWDIYFNGTKEQQEALEGIFYKPER